MIIHELRAAPSPDLARALEQFEGQFRYPLGAHRFFRIMHGPDYPRFFRAMGEGICFVAEKDERILGVMGAAIRPLAMPDGTERDVVYLGDVKTAPAARGGRTLLRLAEAVRAWAGTRVESAYAVVMDGTTATPVRYTGRLGIPLFSEVGKVMVLHFDSAGFTDNPDPRWLATREMGGACYDRLSGGSYACRGGDPSERSEMTPLWLMAPDERACGRLEDTRRAKRLMVDDGAEMRSAHLSCFAYAEPISGAGLLRMALRQAARHGFPGLFVSVPAGKAPALREALNDEKLTVAPATVFGACLESWDSWMMNSAEI